jgi:hypothetical protein
MKEGHKTKKYCVYGHYDDSGKVFYVGAGDPDRPFVLRPSCRTKYWNDYVSKNCASGKPTVKVWHQNLDKMSAYEHEKFWIEVYGRSDLGKGTLINKTNGGGGLSGFLYTNEALTKMKHPHSPESKAKISAATKGKKRKPFSPETRAKMSAAMKGKPKSPEAVAKLVAALKGRKQPPESIEKMIKTQRRNRELKKQMENEVSK